MRSLIRSAAKICRIAPNPAFLASTLKINLVSSTKPLVYKPVYSFSNPIQAHQNISKSNFEGEGFYVEQLLTGCLSIYSYYIQSNGQAFLVDPLNQIAAYDSILKQRKAQLKGVFLSHYHADYIAGHYELEKKYGCKVYMGPRALESNRTAVAKDNQVFNIGSVNLKVLHTPGHTEESSCLLLTDAKGKQVALFTGDTVFLNEVGRPDLAVKSDLTKEDLASLLFDSLQKLKTLDKEVRIYPGHGAGSSCGKSIGKGDYCILGTQLENNYGLKETNKQKFINQVLSHMPSPPQYFGHDAYLNKYSPFDYEEVQKFVMNKIPSEKLQDLVNNDSAIIIDVRPLEELSKGVIEGAITIDFKGAFANWVGTIMSPKKYYIIYGAEDIAQESIRRLLRIGYTNVAGYCTDSIEQAEKHNKVFKPEFVRNPNQEGYQILDVRKPREWEKSHASSAIHSDLTNIFSEYKKLDKSKKYLVHCQSGFRARIALSFLKSKGFDAKALILEFDEIGKSGVKMIEGK